MKRITVRPGKVVAVSDEALGRARNALAAFGIDDAQVRKALAFKGDVTLGKAHSVGVFKVRAVRPKASVKRGSTQSAPLKGLAKG